jgi:hypothetical protein
LLEPKQRSEFILAKVAKFKKRIARNYVWKKNEIELAFNRSTGRPLPNDIQRNQRAIDQALRTYQPQLYGGRITIFRAATQPYGIAPDSNLGWSGMARGGLDVHEVPGFHGAVTVDPHAKFLAEKLRPCLTIAQHRYERDGSFRVPITLDIAH